MNQTTTGTTAEIITIATTTAVATGIGTTIATGITIATTGTAAETIHRGFGAVLVAVELRIQIGF